MKYPKINMLPGARPKKKQRSVVGGPVRLPALNSTSHYLKPPVQRAKQVLDRSRFKQILNEYNAKRMCGICGTVHAPGESHRSRKAAAFNAKTGQSRL